MSPEQSTAFVSRALHSSRKIAVQVPPSFSALSAFVLRYVNSRDLAKPRSPPALGGAGAHHEKSKVVAAR